MVEYAVRDRSDRPRRARTPALDLLASKLRTPLIRRGTVVRLGLMERLASSDTCPIVSVVAPAGYGKTTLLSQWAERHGQAFAWVSVDEKDNDPKVLVTYVAEALDAVEPISERIFDALSSPGSSVLGWVVPQPGPAFAAMTLPVVLVLDDVHALRNFECRAALPVLADHVPLDCADVVAQAPRRHGDKPCRPIHPPEAMSRHAAGDEIDGVGGLTWETASLPSSPGRLEKGSKMTMWTQGSRQSPEALTPVSGGPARQSRTSGRDSKTTWRLVGLALLGHMLRSRRFYEKMAFTAIAMAALSGLSKENREKAFGRVVAWNKRQIQAFEAKAEREAGRLERKARR